MSARKALNATEVGFGIFESARKRGRVEFPLTTGPLEAMVAEGMLAVESADGPSDERG